MQKLKACYSDYIAASEKAERNKSAWNGAFGIGTSTKDHPCHDMFYEAVGAWCEAFLAGDPTQAQAEEAVRFLLESADQYRDTPVYWYMYAAQGLARPLIPLTGPRFAADMRQWYREHYPRRDRLPVQQEVYKLLKKQEKA